MAGARLTVRAQLTLWSAGIVAVALTLFGFGLRYGVERVLTGALDRRLASEAAAFLHHPPPHRRQDGPGPDNPPIRGLPYSAGDEASREGQAQDGLPGTPGDGNGPPAGQFQDGVRPPRDDRPSQDAALSGAAGGGFAPQRNDQGREADPSFVRPEDRRRNRNTSDEFPLLVIDEHTGVSDSPPRGSSPWSQEAYEQAMRSHRELFSYASHDGLRIRVCSLPFQTREGDEKIIQTADDIREINVAVGGVVRALLMLIPASILLTGAGGLLLASRVLRPIGRLAEAAARLEATEMSARLPGDESRDEFGRLTGVLNGMLARLEAAFDRQKRFSADASHELRTPLATIKAQTSLALDDSTLTLAEARESLASIDRAADRAERLIRDLLLLVKLGALPVRIEPVLLRETLLEAVRSSKAVAPPSQARVVVEMPETRVLATDRDHLLRLIGNLLDNAIRHTPPEGTVTLRTAELPGGALLISVADTGPGIAPEHLEKLGQPFYRVDSSRNRRSGGTGLGLAICFGLAQSLGGSLRLESAVGKGTTAFLTLPG